MTEKELCSNMYKSIEGALSELEQGHEFDARIMLILARQLAEKELRELQYPPFSPEAPKAEMTEPPQAAPAEEPGEEPEGEAPKME